MEETGCDPYRSPLSELSECGSSATWFVQDGRLIFRDDAVLPEVDLFTGRDDVLLSPESRVFEAAQGGRSVWLYVGIMLMAVTAVVVRRSLDLNLILAILGLMILSYLIGILLRKSVVSGMIHFYLSEDGEVRPKWRGVVQWGLAMGGIGFFLGTVLVNELNWMMWGFGVMCLCLVLLVVMRLAPAGLKCSGSHDGWFVLEGVPVAGLQALARLQSEEDPDGDHE